MKAQPERLLLAIFSALEDEPEKAYQSLRSMRSAHVALLRPDASAAGSRREVQRFATLRLPGETLLAARLPDVDVPLAVRQLQATGAPAIFVFRVGIGRGRFETTAQRQAAASRTALLARVAENQEILDAIRRDLMEAARLGHALTPAAEWILDNGYLVRMQSAEVRRYLPRDYPKHLPVDDRDCRQPRIYDIARELVLRRDFAIDRDSIVAHLTEYQQHTPLRIAELWLFPLLLRVCLVEELTCLALRVHEAQQLREQAYLWANRLAAAARHESGDFERMLELLENEPFAVEPHFVISLAEQLHGEEAALAPVQRWAEQRLQTRFGDLVRQEHLRESAERLSVANAFGSLRAFARIDFTEIFETVSLLEAELRTDPGAVYPHSDFTTRDRCRRAVERIARRSTLQECEVAQLAIGLARQHPKTIRGTVVYYLLDAGLPELEAGAHATPPAGARIIRGLRRHATPCYISSIVLLTAAFLAIAIAFALQAGVHSPAVLAVLGLLAIFPLSELSVQVVNALVISLIPPDTLPKMDFREGIPEEDTTLVVVPMMLTSVAAAVKEVEKLEVRYLANQESYVYFSLFADFTDSPDPSTAQDQELLDVTRRAIAALNERYEDRPFLLFHRNRVWSESEQVWMGRERKRGKLEELNAFLCGAGPGDILIEGEMLLPVRYIITLDADTQLPPGVARRMIETIAHPLNRAEIDPEERARRRGFTIIQPRVSIALPGATATRFTRIFADTSGTDPYCKCVSDAYQDLFGEAAFHGKAIYDVHAFRTILGDRFPAETILSHDLIEGAHAGVGLASDIELFESLPLDYASFTKREHRWIRGDWQIAAWVLRHVPARGGRRERNPLSLINRWRILDNLRRSLAPIASLLLLLVAWLISAAPGVWTLVVALAVVIPALAPLLERAAHRVQGTVHRWRGAEAEFVRALVMIAFLPYQAWLSADAVIRVLYRRHVSRRHLLEWQTGDGARGDNPGALRRLLAVSGGSLALMVVSGLEGRLLPTAVFLVPWAVSPALMRWLDRPALSRIKPLRRADTAYLRTMARRTWRFFDDLVGPVSNWLPPDNTQLALRVEVAQRTSPTNIGMWLSAALAATDFGYLTTDQFVERIGHTLGTIDGLEKYEGHLLNWYHTATLEPLQPRYVSTADSGNLLASCWVLERGCEDMLHKSLLGDGSLQGLLDTESVVRDFIPVEPALDSALQQLRRLLRGRVAGHHLASRIGLAAKSFHAVREMAARHHPGDERGYWVGKMAHALDAWSAVVDRYLAWMRTLAAPADSFVAAMGEDAVQLRRRALESVPSIEQLAAGGCTPLQALLARRGLPGVTQEHGAWLDQIAIEVEAAQVHAFESREQLRDLSNRVRRLADGIDMSLLYDRQRRLFGIGYLVGGPVSFTSHYDLLASESRLASLVAIANSQAPVQHWYTLGRPRAIVDHGHQALLSWSGTMFEYLMPVLYMRLYEGSLLDQACQEAVRLQIDYGNQNAVPWGMSESAYSAIDAHQIYQYRAFGIPTLALKAGMEEDLVVAPYATMLALMIEPAESVENLRRLETFGLTGPMGFYESIDFGIESEPGGRRGVVVYNYMSHHQGMSLVAMGELLNRNPMRRRFHGDTRVRAVEPLLFEGVPVTMPTAGEIHTTTAPVRVQPEEEPAERSWREDTVIPRVHLQGNGRYALMVTNAGGGYSRWRDFDITRWRDDATADCWGAFVYLRDLKSDAVWSAAYQPVLSQDGESSVQFSADRAEFQRRFFGIETVTSVTVAPDDDAELRRVTITNRSLRSRELEITSYLELAMAPHRADTAHPAFHKLFIQTEPLEGGGLIARRRRRDPKDPEVWTAHIVTGAPHVPAYESERLRFLGRGRTPADPLAIRGPLSGSTGTVIDPVFSLRCRLELDPRDRIELTFITLAASSREALLDLVAKYRDPAAVGRVFELSWTRAQLEFRYLGIGPAAAHRFDELAGHVLFPTPALRPSAAILAANRLGQSTLWAYGISGDLPIVTVIVSTARHLPLVREVLTAHQYWRLRGLMTDLVILNQESPDYERPLHEQLVRQIEAHSAETGTDRPGGVFLREWYHMPEEHRTLILAASRVLLTGARGSLAQQLAGAVEKPQARPFVPSGGEEEPSPPLPFLELPYFNGTGGFTSDGKEYAVYLGEGNTTPAPWVNVMANPDFGTMVSESGLGFTWYGNSQANRLTPWHNDPVSDPQSEAIYIRDSGTGAVWTPTALPIREQDAYRARHGQGYTVYEHNSHAIEQELTVFVPMNEHGGDAVKICRLRLRNASSIARSLSVTYYAEWVLGTVREEMQMHVRVARDEASGALLATQHWSGCYQDRVAFAASSPRAASWSGDRAQFLGRDGLAARPDALTRARLDNRTGVNLDPAAALQVEIHLPPGGSEDVVFLLGEARGIDDVRALVERYQDAAAVHDALEATRRWWDQRLDTIQVRTPVLSADFLLNRWLPYQALSCRFWGRSALYQSSGAFGFRDQLQDSMALLYFVPEVARRHILNAAARQFVEGDVQHWWHAETGNGVRTRCSDDLAWLPFVTAHYVAVTGDHAILDEVVPFLEGPPLHPGELERMFVPTVSPEAATLAEHCRRALDRAWTHGPHGLPLIGLCDWNDGFSNVGVEGSGESVWLAWFLCAVGELWGRGDVAALAAAVEQHAWDGEWYIRAFFDDGAPLGSNRNFEARIDSIAQSWAVLSGAGDPARMRRAMESAERWLVDDRNRLVLLFTPPFDHSEPHPGYIMGYPPGVRENGGQYTHGSLWLPMAWARLGDGETAVRLLNLMSPVELSRSPAMVERYRGEPYVVAADVYSAPGHVGQAGWTWYTGSASWMYRVWLEEVLGFKLRGATLAIDPRVPASWEDFGIRFRYRSATYDIDVRRGVAGRTVVELDGAAVRENVVQLVDDGAVHQVKVWLPPRTSPSAPEGPVAAQSKATASR